MNKSASLETEKGLLDCIFILAAFILVVYYPLAFFFGWEKNPKWILLSSVGLGVAGTAVIVYSDDGKEYIDPYASGSRY